MRLTLSYDRLAGLGHRSNIFDADMYRPCQISSSPLHPPEWRARYKMFVFYQVALFHLGIQVLLLFDPTRLWP